MATNPLGLLAQYASDSEDETESSPEKRRRVEREGPEAVEDFLKEMEQLGPLKVEEKGGVQAPNQVPASAAETNSEGGWSTVPDPNTGYNYYWNSVTNEVRWDPPPGYNVDGRDGSTKISPVPIATGSIPHPKSLLPAYAAEHDVKEQPFSSAGFGMLNEVKATPAEKNLPRWAGKTVSTETHIVMNADKPAGKWGYLGGPSGAKSDAGDHSQSNGGLNGDTEKLGELQNLLATLENMEPLPVVKKAKKEEAQEPPKPAKNPGLISFVKGGVIEPSKTELGDRPVTSASSPPKKIVNQATIDGAVKMMSRVDQLVLGDIDLTEPAVIMVFQLRVLVDAYERGCLDHDYLKEWMENAIEVTGELEKDLLPNGDWRAEWIGVAGTAPSLAARVVRNGVLQLGRWFNCEKSRYIFRHTKTRVVCRSVAEMKSYDAHLVPTDTPPQPITYDPRPAPPPLPPPPPPPPPPEEEFPPPPPPPPPPVDDLMAEFYSEINSLTGPEPRVEIDIGSAENSSDGFGGGYSRSDSQERSISPEGQPQSQKKKTKKPKPVKVEGLGLKKKKVSSMIAKWQQVQHDL